jgi:hypothetical protein
MIDIFANVVLPVFIVAGLGYAAERKLHIPIAPISQTALYVLVPSLIFTSLLQVDFRGGLPLQIAAFGFLSTMVLLALALAVSRLLRMDRPTTSAMMLTTAFPNSANYALPVILFAYGQAGVTIGLLLVSVQSVYATTLALLVASSGKASIGGAIATVFRLPLIYAVIAALVLNLTQVPVPHPLTAALAVPGQAAIPLLLTVLGMQLGTTTKMEEPSRIVVAVVLRLFVGVLVGAALTGILGITGLARQVLIVGSAMPSAVFTIVMASEFDARPRFVTDVVIVSTLVSIATVTVVLTLLSGGIQ